MGVEDVLLKLKELMGESLLTLSQKEEISRLYKLVLAKNFIKTSCNDCYKDALIEMYAYLKKHGKMKEKSNYTLKNGALIQLEFGSSEMYTNANITDEIAEKFLSENPNNRRFFSELPFDWEARVKNRVSGESDKLVNEIAGMLDSGSTDEDIKVRYKGFVVDGKRVSQKMISSFIEEAKKMI